MNTTNIIAIISTLSLIGFTLCSCSANKTNEDSLKNATVLDDTTEEKASETTTTAQTTKAEEETTAKPTEVEEDKLSEEEQSKINDACIVCLTEFTKMEGYNPYKYPYQYMLCDINEDGIDELIVHYMSMLGETEALYYYKDGEYNEIAFASESGFDICIEGHFIQFSSWDGRDSRNIIKIDGEEFKKDVISILPEGYQHNDVEISEDEFNKLTEQYDSYKWEKPKFEDFSNILPESVAFPEIALGSIDYSTGNNGISSDSIVGKWKAYSIGDSPADGNYGYEFYADGTGYYYNDYTSATSSLTYTSTGLNSYSISFDFGGNPMEGWIENGYLVTENNVYLVRVY